jgi:hypothetical protein
MGAVERCSVRRTRPSDPRKPPAPASALDQSESRQEVRISPIIEPRSVPPARVPKHEMPQPQDDIAEDDITQDATA